MTAKFYLDLYHRLKREGFEKEIEWIENLKPCENAEEFLSQYIWVVLCSGFSEKAARAIETRLWEHIRSAPQHKTAFISGIVRNRQKRGAILVMMITYQEVFREYQAAVDKLAFLDELYFIGPTTKYHLAKNLGLDVCKPDRHLLRMAAKHKTTPEDLCRRLAKKTGHRVATVDQVLWRAATLGWI